MDYRLLKERIEIIASRMQQIGGEVQEVVIEEPASIEEIVQTEEQLEVKLPESFKKVLTEFSGNFSLRWFLPEDMDPPHEFREIFSGTPNWSLERLPQFENERKGWIDNVFPNPQDEYDVVWHNKLAFCEVGNGDYLAFDMKDDTENSIIYLSHDGGEGHGYKMANNFIEFIDKWSKLGFVGCDDFQWLPFTKSSISGINPDDEQANRFRTWLGLEM